MELVDEEIQSLVPGQGECFVGVDASLRVPNRTGMRSTEKLVRRMGIGILQTSSDYHREKFGGSGENVWSSDWKHRVSAGLA